MAKGMQKGNREVRKPKSNKPKVQAAAASALPTAGVIKKGRPAPGKKPR